jgi:hypothetical protein
MLKNIRPAHIIVLIFLAHAICLVAWVSIDTRPPIWDSASHLNLSLDYLDFIRGLKFLSVLDRSDFYPPLYHLLLVPVHALRGISQNNFVPVNLLFLLALLYVIFRTGELLYSAQAGVCAALAVSANPFMLWNLHKCLLDLPLAALALLCFYFFLKSDGFSIRKYSLLMGISAGLALLIKWGCVFFVFLPALAALAYALCRTAADGREKTRAAANFLLFLLCVLVIAGPWYARHSFQLMANFAANMHNAMAVEGKPPVFSWWSLSFYLKSVIYEFSFYFFIPLAAGAAFLVLRRNRSNNQVIIWTLAGLLAVTLVPNKEYRYGLPLMPFFSLISAHWLAYAGKNRAKYLTAAFAVISCVSLLVNSFFITPRMQAFLIRTGHAPDCRGDAPAREDWKNEFFNEKIAGLVPEGAAVTDVRLLADHPYFHAGSFQFCLRKQGAAKKNIAFLRRFDRDPTELCDFVLYKTGSRGQPFRERTMREAVGLLESGDRSFSMTFREICRAPLPDGSDGILYGLHPREIIAPGNIEKLLLAGIKGYGIDGDGLKVSVRALSPGDSGKGIFRDVSITARRLKAGPLSLTGFRLVLKNPVINLHALLERKRLVLMKLGGVEPSFTLSAGDIREAVNLHSGLKAGNVSVRNGVVYMDAPPLSFRASLSLDSATRRLKFQITRAELFGFLRAPYFSYELAGRIIFNLEPSAGFPARTDINSLYADNDIIRIN